MKYFFIPGRKWRLSLAELYAVLKMYGHDFSEIEVNQSFFIFDIKCEKEQAIELFKRLGGFIKFGYITDLEPFTELENYVLPTLREKSVKCKFSVSSFIEGPSKKKENLKKLGMKIKNWLIEEGVRARFVSSMKDQQTSTVLLEKNHVIEDGFEINLLQINAKQYWGFTLALQDFEGFAKRDFGRPRPNKLKGMLPPKLARIMVNLAMQKPESTIYDPFCGSGGILQEALLLKYAALGSDIDPISIDETKENLEWLKKTFNTHSPVDIQLNDATKGLLGVKFDAIVTEPYLGPVLTRELTEDGYQKAISDVLPVYKSFLDNLSKTKFDKKVIIVLVVPVFKVDSMWKELPVRIEKPFENVKISDKIGAEDLQWDRPHSIIRRSIYILSI